MASFPINPRYAKMLTLASQQEQTSNILSYVICLISGLSVPELFIDGETIVQKEKTTDTATKVKLNCSLKEQQRSDQEKAKQQAENASIKIKYSQMRQSWLNGVPGSHTMLLGDLMLLLVALGAVEYEQHHQNTNTNKEKNCVKFCEQYGIRYKAIVEARKLRKQLVNTGLRFFLLFN
jgi:HrpA-like RNA helicase